MRPNCIQTGTNVYECFHCGNRIEGPESRTCAECGTELVRLGRSRDL